MVVAPRKRRDATRFGSDEAPPAAARRKAASNRVLPDIVLSLQKAPAEQSRRASPGRDEHCFASSANLLSLKENTVRETLMKRMDQKLARIRAGKYKPTDFIIADAKDGDMGPSLTSSGPHRGKDGSWTRHRTRAEFLNEIRAIVKQDILDIMLMSTANAEVLHAEKLFQKSAVTSA